MEGSFSWKDYHRWTDTVQSTGYVILTLGTIGGIVLIVVGGVVTKAIGALVIVLSILVCLYHISFCQIMNAIDDIHNQINLTDSDKEQPVN